MVQAAEKDVNKMKRYFIKLFFFAVALFIIVLASIFKESNAGDRSFVVLDLKQDAIVNHVIDIGQHGMLKKMVNHNGHTVYFRCKAATSNGQLSCRLVGLKGMLSQSSKKGRWKALEEGGLLKSYRGYIPVILELELPKENLNRDVPHFGSIDFFAGGKPYASIKIKVIDSASKQDNKINL